MRKMKKVYLEYYISIAILFALLLTNVLLYVVSAVKKKITLFNFK